MVSLSNKREIDINIRYLHLACHIYQTITDYDKSYLKVLHVGEKKYLEKEDVLALIKWLRDWGCRQFELKCENMSILNFQNWYNNYSQLLPKHTETILNCSFDNFELLFDSLATTKASKKNIGAVGAAKALFALRPNTFVPWDNPIKIALGHKGSGKAYLEYMSEVKEIIMKLAEECETKGENVINLPKLIGRNESTLPKLIDEFYWITITKNFDPKEICRIVTTC